MNRNLPFTISKNESFYERLGDWIGDVFYDILPEKGFELRDEQVYMAFQLEKAFKEKKVIFAEAGVGTGKTISYLLYAYCYARYKGMPAVIACADETLIEQLVKKEGDIEKLERALDIKMDVRLAKSRDQYLCLKKLEHAAGKSQEEKFKDIQRGLPKFVYGQASMLSFDRYGDRRDYPELTENDWNAVAWDPLQDCFSCELRHRCGQTLHREHYRKSADIIVCSHDFYMENVWTKEARKREGQLPLLPEASCVVFDEGHLLEIASQKALTYRISSEMLDRLLNRLTGNEVRDETLYLIEDALQLNEDFFRQMSYEAKEIKGSDRFELGKSKHLLEVANSLRKTIDSLTNQLVYESELFVLNEYDLKIVDEYLDQILYSLKLFIEDNKGIVWYEQNSSSQTLVIMPRLVADILREEVFTKNIPFVFSSATLSNKGDFSYISKSLGIDNYVSFTVDSPFDYEENMSIFIHEKANLEEKWNAILSQLNSAGGKSLILFHTKQAMQQFKEYVAAAGNLPFSVLFEGDSEISRLVEKFQREKETVLCSYHLWEGLDIPGESLSNVLIYSLPFPPHDPVFEARRKNSVSPFEEVDIPYMLLRLKQGIGRLIRTSADRGEVHIWTEKNQPIEVSNAVLDSFPVQPTFVK
ncbi:ATP-dependent DNA helicase [Heyndrickxia acidicola]|uniref:ATP-dependent DNA helicase n=1 Tax=Heyndrickxia acidicola TaxID=209389 RepID=A0ABU6MK32_9BACI|nr:ATP-dependent DNA helicase [Heyndrickxia acidicola]MED1205047.1 ATP-dependent DNA helicase [Heyndrickxia acidicola]